MNHCTSGYCRSRCPGSRSRIGTKLEFSREEKSHMPQHTKVTAIAGWMAALAMLTYGSTAARADITVHVDYSQMSVSYNAGVFSVTDTASSVAHAQTFD